MAKMTRIIEINGRTLVVPPFVNRTVSGWQTRVRGVPSQHFADVHHAGLAERSLAAASQAVGRMLQQR